MWQKTRPFWQVAAAIVAMLCIGGYLNYLAGPAALLDSSALQQRYGSGDSNDARALTLFAEIPYISYLWLLTGCTSIWVAIRFKGVPWALPLLVSLACFAGACAKTFSWEQQHWLEVGTCFGAIASAMFFFANKQRQYRPDEEVLWGRVFFVFGLWFFFLGISVLWLHDLASRGPDASKFKYIGIHQLDSVWLAVMLVAPIVAWGGHKAIVFFTLLSNWWDRQRQRGPWRLLALSAFTPLFMFGLVWLGKNSGKPHISAEIVRLVLTISIAWLMARYYEWGTSMHPYRTMFFLIVVACLATLFLTRDFGPILVLIFASIPAILARNTSARTLTIRQVLVYCAAWFLFFFLVRMAFIHWLPLPLAPGHLLHRLGKVCTTRLMAQADA